MSSGAQARFSFPYAPYPTQDTLMSALYDTFQRKRIGIFESPTGTGKTLCIISAALTWLKDSYDRDETGDVSEDDSAAAATAPAPASDRAPGLPSWLLNSTDRRKEQARQERQYRARERAAARRAVADRLVATKAAVARTSGSSKRSVMATASSSDGAVDERTTAPVSAAAVPTDDDAPLPSPTKIIFCSRTHSQLAQFIVEMKKSRLAVGVRVATLGSRSLLCINEDVRALGSESAMSERCLELQDKSRKSAAGSKAAAKAAAAGDACSEISSDDECVASPPVAVSGGAKPASKKRDRGCSSGCSFYSAERHQTLADLAMCEPLDIEELAGLGRKHTSCPYYAAKAAICDAEVIVMPYNTLLHEGTRESYGLDAAVLSRAVVVFDEAHNIIDAINNMYSCSLSSWQLEAVEVQLSAYAATYKSRMSSQSVLWVSTLVTLVRLLRSFLAGASDDEPGTSIFTVSAFVAAAKLTALDLCGALMYIDNSGIGRKLRGFTATAASRGVVDGTEGTGQSASPVAAFHSLKSMILSLLSTHEDGRVLVKPAEVEDGVTVRPRALKFVLLNSGSRFESIAAVARAVVLIGGTLHPVGNLVSQLLPTTSLHRISTLALGHVVPPERVATIVLSKRPSGEPFNFSFASRDAEAQLCDLGQALANFTAVVPAGSGTVVFFPSYDFEAKVWRVWEEKGIRDRIGRKCKLYREPKTSADMPAILEAYAADTKKGNKALLSCVVGAKLSEGINFSDELARLVVVVGLPFGNVKDVELRARMQYLDSLAGVASKAAGPYPPITGREYYTDLCMKAVNQSIGRSIRHAGDFACIVLVDERYDGADAQARLPAWVRGAGKQLSYPTFGAAYQAAAGFFKRNAAPAAAAP